MTELQAVTLIRDLLGIPDYVPPSTLLGRVREELGIRSFIPLLQGMRRPTVVWFRVLGFGLSLKRGQRWSDGERLLPNQVELGGYTLRFLHPDWSVPREAVDFIRTGIL